MFEPVASLLFLLSGIAVVSLRLRLLVHFHEHRDLYPGVEEPPVLRFGDAFALRLLQRLERRPAGLRILSVLHFIAWLLTWTLPFLLVGYEVWLRMRNHGG
jgi:hypothetical protein